MYVVETTLRSTGELVDIVVCNQITAQSYEAITSEVFDLTVYFVPLNRVP